MAVDTLEEVLLPVEDKECGDVDESAVIPPEENAKCADKKNATENACLKICVISDDAGLQGIIKFEAKMRGFEVVREKNKPDVIFLDLEAHDSMEFFANHATTRPRVMKRFQIIGLYRDSKKIYSVVTDMCNICVRRPFDANALFSPEICHSNRNNNPKTVTNGNSDKIHMEGPYVVLRDNSVKLGPVERILLEEMIAHEGELISKAEIGKLLNLKNPKNMSEVHICKLRRKLRNLTNQNLIVTKTGKGYIFFNENYKKR